MTIFQVEFKGWSSAFERQAKESVAFAQRILPNPVQLHGVFRGGAAPKGYS